MSETTHKERLWQIDLNLMAINQEIRDGHWQDDCLQEAVYCQVEINRMVWELNQLRDRAVKDEMEKLARPKGKWIVNRYDSRGVCCCNKCFEQFVHVPMDGEGVPWNYCPNCGADMKGEEDD